MRPWLKAAAAFVTLTLASPPLLAQWPPYPTPKVPWSTFGSLQIDVTIEDPASYTRPFTVRVNRRIMLDSELVEFVCQENEKSSAHYDP